MSSTGTSLSLSESLHPRQVSSELLKNTVLQSVALAQTDKHSDTPLAWWENSVELTEQVLLSNDVCRLKRNVRETAITLVA